MNRAGGQNTRAFLTSREAAELLGVALSTVQQWTENGLLRAWKTAGGHRRITRQSVEAVLRQQRAVSDHQPLADNATLIVVVNRPQARRRYERWFTAGKLPWQPLVTGSVCEGLLEIGRRQPDVAIIDLQGPDGDAGPVVEAIRAMPWLGHTVTIVIGGADCASQPVCGNFYTLPGPADFDTLEVLLARRTPQSRRQA